MKAPGGKALALATGAASVAAILAVPGIASASSTTIATPPCAWRVELSPSKANALLPDSNAVYWIMPYTVQPGLNIVLHGAYADARYTSLTAYTAQFAPFTRTGVSSALDDFKIAPDAGSVNPWQQPAAPGGKFTVTLRANVSTASANALPLAPQTAKAGATGYVVYRVYQSAVPDSEVALPAVSFRIGARTTKVATCASQTRSATLPTSMASAVSAPSKLGSGSTAGSTGVTRQFSRNTSSMGSLFPNPDNGYLTAQVTPPSGDNFVVIRGKAPTTPGGDDPKPWPSSADVRYWSLCTYVPVPPLPVVSNTLPDGTVDNGCRSDLQTTLDASGYYTFVLGTEAQRSEIESMPGVTFVPYSSQYLTSSHLVFLRNLIGNFPEAVQNVPADFNPATAAAVMGDYYPEAGVCSLSTLEAAGHC